MYRSKAKRWGLAGGLTRLSWLTLAGPVVPKLQPSFPTALVPRVAPKAVQHPDGRVGRAPGRLCLGFPTLSAAAASLTEHNAQRLALAPLSSPATSHLTRRLPPPLGACLNPTWLLC